MKALLKEGASLQVASVPRPVVMAPDDVILQVALAGVCRTDVYVASGRLPCRDPLILGHEVAGTVVEVGPAVAALRPGDLASVSPLLPCRRCPACLQGVAPCHAPQLLGVHEHGAFAELLRVPAAVVHRAPPSLSAREVAYTEPLAAALAVLKAGLRRDERGLIYGTGRIAALVQRVLAAAGLGHVPLHAVDAPLPPAAYDYIIETVATSAALAQLLPAVRCGGRIVLKSRPPEPALWPIAAAVLREVSLCAVAYGPFDEALRWLVARRVEVADLLGEVYPLDDFAHAFIAASGAEARKVFLQPPGAAQRA